MEPSAPTVVGRRNHQSAVLQVDPLAPAMRELM